MPSLNVDLNYFDHPKTMRLVARLGPGADVLPIRLWAYIGRHHPESGRLALLEAEFEHVCAWWGEKGLMLTAMIEIGFVKRDGEFFEINDWIEHSGHLSAFKKRAEKAARKRWGIKKKSSNATSITKQEVKQSPCSTVLSSTVPSITNPIPKGAFDLIWARYPRRDGRKAAEKHFKASVEKFQDWLDIQNALSKYLEYIRFKKTEPQFIKMGSTWFNNWQDWVNYTEDSHGTPPDGRAGDAYDSDIVRRTREIQGLGKVSVQEAARPIHAGVRDRPMHGQPGQASPGSDHGPDAKPVV